MHIYVDYKTSAHVLCVQICRHAYVEYKSTGPRTLCTNLQEGERCVQINRRTYSTLGIQFHKLACCVRTNLYRSPYIEYKSAGVRTLCTNLYRSPYIEYKSAGVRTLCTNLYTVGPRTLSTNLQACVHCVQIYRRAHQCSLVVLSNENFEKSFKSIKFLQH